MKRQQAAAFAAALALVVAAAVVGAGATSAARERSAPLPAPISLDGVGGVQPGMKIAEVRRRWAVALRLQSTRGSECATAAVRRGSLVGHAIFFGDSFGAVFFQAGARTIQGIRIGSTLSELRATFGNRLQSRPNKYLRGARDFFVLRRTSPRWQLRFDVSPAGRVTVIAFGDQSVRLVEGCG